MGRALLARREAILFAALIVVSILTRVSALGRYITPDELVWVFRSVQFREAILNAQWSETLTAGHPGVITTWLGALGITAQLVLSPADVAHYEWITKVAWLTPDNMNAFTELARFLTAGRLAVILANTLGVGAIYRLGKIAIGQKAAILAAFLLALDPFLAGLSGLLHADALLSTFATCSLLSLAIYSEKRGRLHYLALSAALASLALLTKSPAILLLPVAILTTTVVHYRTCGGSFSDFLWQWIRSNVVLIGAFVFTLLILFPALWVTPVQVAETVIGIAGRHVESALRPTFFFGKVAHDHGLAFYPVALLFRLSPVVLFGIVVAAVNSLRNWGAWRDKESCAVLLSFVWFLLYLIMVSVAVKKFDRYMLPIFPPLILVASVALVRSFSPTHRPQEWLISAVVVMQALYLLSVYPYPLTAYNPLAGGSRVAEKVLNVGWGEAISAAGRWLAEQSSAEQKRAVAAGVASLAPFFPGETLSYDEENASRADYVIITKGDLQLEPNSIDQVAREGRLVHTVILNGRESAWIYRKAGGSQETILIPDLDPIIVFGGRVRLLGALTEWSTREHRVVFHARWQLNQPGGRYSVKLALKDENGSDWGGLETALLNGNYFHPEHWESGEIVRQEYPLSLPPAIPPAVYRLRVQLVDAEDGALLPLTDRSGSFQGLLYLDDVPVMPREKVTKPRELDIPQPKSTTWMKGTLELLGFTTLPDSVTAGTQRQVDLFWQAHGRLPSELELLFALDGHELSVQPLSRFDSGQWRPGEVIQEKYRLVFPPDLNAGRLVLEIRPLLSSKTSSDQRAFILGEIDFREAGELFTLPEDIPVALSIDFGQTIHLGGLEPASPTAQPGGSLHLTLYWRTDTFHVAAYNAFVHVLDANGQIVAQDDHWPGGIPSDTWTAGQVIIDQYAIEIPEDLPPGQYQLVTGVYNTADGVRLPITGSSGEVYPDRRAILPVTLTVLAPE